MNLLQAILCGGIYWFYAVYFGYPLWGICAQPLVTCTIVGAIMGDVTTGALCGAAIAPLYIALSGAGGVVTADKSASSIIPTAMVIVGNLDIAAGIALAVPVSLLFSQIHNVLKLVNTYIVHRCDAAAERGDDKAIIFNSVILVNLVKILLYWVPMTVILYIGAMSVEGLADQIPAWLSNGLAVVSTMLPALGIGMTMVVIGRKDLLPFFVAGFFLVAYTGIANMPLLILGLVLAYMYLVFTKENTEESGSILENTAEEPKNRLLTKHDVIRTYNRWWSTVDMSLSFERLQGMSVCFAMIPGLRKLYKDQPEEFKSSLKRHLQFFNTEGIWGSAIHGIVLSMEEQKALGAPITDDAISSVKVGLMGPFAGIGDTIDWSIFIPMTFMFFIPYQQSGAWWPGFVAITIVTVVMYFVGRYLCMTGYSLGTQAALKILEGNFVKRLISFFGVLGLFMLGGLAVSYVDVSIKPVIASGVSYISIQKDIFDAILPKLPTFLTILGVYAGLKKDRKNIIRLSFILILVGLVLGALGILGTPVIPAA